MESGVSENAVSGHVQLVKPGETACFAVRKSTTFSTHVFQCLIEYHDIWLGDKASGPIILIAVECYITGSNHHSLPTQCHSHNHNKHHSTLVYTMVINIQVGNFHESNFSWFGEFRQFCTFIFS